ncbi:MAG: NAD(P)-binding protein [Alphaproteobacteria bacterium]|nr:NAD(P)-binding protein [Alphaproteobacteria bacterium]
MRKPFAITLDVGSSLANLTGSWRTERPLYVDLLPPCNHACPAGENIQQWLYLAEEGDYEGAWRIIMEQNPMPALHGRVCYHPCEDACNRGQLDQAVSVHAVERFLGDEALRRGWRVTAGAATGKHVLVIGGGPSGLSAAYHLRRLGHAVTIHDAFSQAGGMMRFGIPKYRLPRDVLDDEIARIAEMGVTIELDSKVDDVSALMTGDGFDATFVAVGAHIGKRTDIPARDAGKILDAVSVLHGVEESEPLQLGRRVVVYGGGDTALDVARTAKRLGAAEATVVYRRSRAQMPAHDLEVEQALDESVEVHWLRTIHDIDHTTFTIEKMEIDENGWPQPTGAYETLEGDTLVLALGQSADTEFLKGVPGLEIASDGVVAVDETMMTGFKGLFAGGDMVPAERSVTVAVGHGKKAARHIDGSWCFKDGRHMTIDGPKIRTPGGTRISGIYDRHAFSYVVPKGEPGAGGTTEMYQVNDEVIRVKPATAAADAPLETWRRCRMKMSQPSGLAIIPPPARRVASRSNPSSRTR